MVVHTKCRRRFWGAVAIIVLLSAALGVQYACGEIIAPSETPEYQIVDLVAKTSISTDGGQLHVRGTGWVVPKKLDVRPRDYNPSGAAPAAEIFVTGPPGTYDIRHQIVWVVTREVDVAGQKVPMLVDFGMSDDVATITITGDSGPVPPGPTPGPNAPYRIQIFYKSHLLDNMPSPQRAILTSLSLREQIRAQGHNLLTICDATALNAGSIPAELKPWWDAAKDKELPVICLAPLTERGTIKVYPLPADSGDLFELLNRK